MKTILTIVIVLSGSLFSEVLSQRGLYDGAFKGKNSQHGREVEVEARIDLHDVHLTFDGCYIKNLKLIGKRRRTLAIVEEIEVVKNGEPKTKQIITKVGHLYMQKKKGGFIVLTIKSTAPPCIEHCVDDYKLVLYRCGR